MRGRDQEAYDAWVRSTHVPLLVLAIVFLVALVLPIAEPDLRAGVRHGIDVLNVLIWAAFAVDYGVRLYLCTDRRRFVRSNVLDLVVVAVPLLRALRVLRVLRLVGLGGRVANASRPFHSRVVGYVAGTTLVTVVVAAAATVEAERAHPDATITTFPDALWWAVTTVTTADAYGGRSPVSAEGRLVGVCLTVVGIALLGVVTAAMAAWFVDRLTATRREVTRAVNEETDQVLAAIADLRERIDRLESRLDRG